MTLPPSPTCPHCHGSGSIEFRNTRRNPKQGQDELWLTFEPCPCTQRPLVVAEEDWSNG